MSKCQRNSSQLCNKKRSHSFIKCSSVHVNRCANRYYKSCYARIQSHIVQTLNRNRHRRRAVHWTVALVFHLWNWILNKFDHLDPVPNAVANTCPIFEMERYGSRLTTRKKSIGIVTSPWTNRPTITVMKYIPNWPIISVKLTISNTFDRTKKNTPNGDSLNTYKFR